MYTVDCFEAIWFQSQHHKTGLFYTSVARPDGWLDREVPWKLENFPEVEGRRTLCAMTTI